MKDNLVLIGMPGAGKSTVGVTVAKLLALGFLDTDLLIQNRHRQSLQQILDQTDYLNLRRLEEEEILTIHTRYQVIATGGSAVYSPKAMAHLTALGLVIYLQVEYEEIVRRITNFSTRGIAKSAQQTFQEVYTERQLLYRRYAEATIDCTGLDQEQVAEGIAALWPAQDGRGRG